MEQRDFLRKQMLKKTREQIEEKFAGKEIHIIKAINLLMDLDSINNLMSENLNEWKTRNPQDEAQNQFESLQKNTTQIQEEKTKLIEFIEKEMQEEFPNFSQIATPIIGAKLLSEAGSKKRLCFMPASTIQVLGAEKALFAHLRKNAKSPKHGHLFNHPLLQNMPRFKRGKAARIIAGKLAIALKQDYFKGKDTSKEVKEELEKRIVEIRNEPETESQRQRENDYEQINEDRRREAFNKEDKKKDYEREHKTFTPEERKAYFEKNNKGKPWNKKPIENYPPREGSLSQKRKFGSRGPREFSNNYNNRTNEGFNSNDSFNAPRERSYSTRPRSFNGARSFNESRRFGSDKPQYGTRRGPRTFTQDKPSYGNRDSNYNKNPYLSDPKSEFNPSYNTRPKYSDRRDGNSRPSGSSKFKSSGFKNKSKTSFNKRTPRTAKRY